jgi:chromosome segregation ATPase
MQCDELHGKYQNNIAGKQKQLQLVQRRYNEAQKTAETNKAKFDKDKDMVETGKKTLKTLTKTKTELQQKVRRVCRCRVMHGHGPQRMPTPMY